MGAEQSKTQKSLSQSIDYLAANYILTSNFQDLKDLSDASSCKELVVLTSDVLNKYLTEKDVSFLQQRMEGTEEKNYMTKKSLAYFNEGKIDDMDVKSDLQKKRMCLGIAKFYIRIFHVFNAIAHTVNPEYSWTDMYGQKHKVGYEDKSKIPRDAKYTITKMNLCSEKMNALIDKANLDIIKEDDNSKNIDITPKFCGINVSKSGGTANLQEEPGMPELEKLYYDQYNYTTGKFQSMSPDMKEVYMEDVKTLYKAFTGKKESMPDTIKSFSDIRLRDFENIVQCQNNGVFTKTYTGSLKEKQFLAYADNIRLMQKNTLENQQVLMKILDKLFAFTPNPREKGKKMVTIHPNLNEKSLDKIVAETRTAILKMYSTCEKDFFKGLQLFEAIVWKQMLDTSVKQIDNLNQDIDNALNNTGAQANQGPRVDGNPGDKGKSFPDHFQRPGQMQQPPGYQANVGDRVGAQEGEAAANMTPGKVRIKREGKNNGDESSSDSENSDEEDNKRKAIEKKLANSPTEVRKQDYQYQNPILPVRQNRGYTEAPNIARYGNMEESEVEPDEYSRFDNANARTNKKVTFSSNPVNNNEKGSASVPAASLDAPTASAASTDAAEGTSNTKQGLANVKEEPGEPPLPAADTSDTNPDTQSTPSAEASSSPPAAAAAAPAPAPAAAAAAPAPAAPAPAPAAAAAPAPAPASASATAAAPDSTASALSSPVKDAPSCTSDPFKIIGTCVLAGEHEIFIDKQVRQYCGMHAINNLFGLQDPQTKIQIQDMRTACGKGNRKTTERFQALGIQTSEIEIERVCEDDGGNCNLSVVVDILENVIPERLKTEINLVIMPEYQKENIGKEERTNLKYDKRDENCISNQVNKTDNMVGCIVSLNQQGHFAAFRFMSDGYYFIDSTRADIMFYSPEQLTQILMDKEIINGIIIVRKGMVSPVYTCMEMDKENEEVRKKKQEVIKELKSKNPLDESPSKSGITPVDPVDLADAQEEDEAAPSESSLDDDNSYKSAYAERPDKNPVNLAEDQSDSRSQEVSDVTMDIDPPDISGEQVHAQALQPEALMADPVVEEVPIQTEEAAATPPATDSSTAAANQPETASAIPSTGSSTTSASSRKGPTTIELAREYASGFREKAKTAMTAINNIASNFNIPQKDDQTVSSSSISGNKVDQPVEEQGECEECLTSRLGKYQQTHSSIRNCNNRPDCTWNDDTNKCCKIKENSSQPGAQLLSLSGSEASESKSDTISSPQTSSQTLEQDGDNESEDCEECLTRVNGKYKVQGCKQHRSRDCEWKNDKCCKKVKEVSEVDLDSAKANSPVAHNTRSRTKGTKVKGGGARSKKKKHSKKHRKNSRKKSRSMKRIKKLKK